jgi:hypothetical protein
MCKRMMLIIFGIAIVLLPTYAQEKPTIVVHAFTVANGVTWPYDVKQLQFATVTQLKAKNADQFDAVSDAAASLGPMYILDGEVQQWQKGNVVERMTIAMGSVAGRENAKIHFWLTDKDGKKVFEATETIRQQFMRNVHEKSSGMLAQPFVEKISERLKDAKPGA